MVNEGFDFKLNGAEELKNALNSLRDKKQIQFYKALLSKLGREDVVKPLKAAIDYSKKTEDTIKVVTDSRNPLKVSAGVSSKGYPLRFADLGTKERVGKKGQNKGKSKGKIVGKHQIQPVLEESPDRIIKDFNENAGEYMGKIFERDLKKIKKRL
jgi:hypothetical protein